MDQPPKKLSPEIVEKLKREKAKREAAKKAAEEISAATKNEQDESSRLPGGTGTISDERGTRFYKNGELYHQTTRSDYAPATPTPEVTTEPTPEIKTEASQEKITKGFDTDGRIIKIGDTIYWSNQDKEDTYYSGEILSFKRDPNFHFLMADIKMPDGKIELMYLAGSHLIKPTKKVENANFSQEPIPEKIDKAEENSAESSEEALKQPPAPEAPATGSNEEKLAAIAETIKNAKRTIEELNLELAEALRAEKSDRERALETELAALNKEFKKNKAKLDDVRESILKRMLWFWRVSQYEKENTELSEKIYDKERLLALERDRKENPFKYFLIDSMAEKNRKIMFGEKPILSEINDKMGIDGRVISPYWRLHNISKRTDYMVNFSPAGFYIKVGNPEKIKNQGGETYEAITQNGEITYDLVGPDGSTSRTGLKYEDATRFLEEEATLYQEEQLDLFTYEMELRELQSIVGLDAKKEFLERKKIERIRNIREVKHWIDYHTNNLNSEYGWMRRQAQDYLNIVDRGPAALIEYFREQSEASYISEKGKEISKDTIKKIKDLNTRYDNLIASL